MVGRGAVRGVTCVLIMVLVLVWNHSILYGKKYLGFRECSRESNARHRPHRSERSALLRISPNSIAASHMVGIWH
jgi:hypothetical protein